MSKSYMEVVQAVEADSRDKQDYITPVRNLRVNQDGFFEMMSHRGVRPPEGHGAAPRPDGLNLTATDWAEGQLLGWLGMPVSYFRKAKAENPELFAGHFNYWAERSDKELMLRTKISSGSQQGLIRGAVSKSYGILNNLDLLDILGRILQKGGGNYEVASYYLDDHRFHLRLIFNEATKQLGTLPDGMPDYNQLGTDHLNSEVGASSYNLQALIWRLICSNGMRGWGSNGEAFNQRHVHLRPIEFQARVANEMVKALNAGAEMLDDFQQTQEQQIANPFAVIKRLAKDHGFSQDFTDNVTQNFEMENTAYGVINAFTRASRDLPNKQRLSAEHFAGTLTKLKASRWEQLDRLELEKTAV